MIPESTTFNAYKSRKTQGFKNKLKILLGGVCCLLLLLITVISIPVYIFRIVVILLAKIFRPDFGDIFNGLSSLFANDYFYNNKSTNKSPRSGVVVSIIIHGRDLSLQELKEILLEGWIRKKDNRSGKLSFQEFQQYPVRWMGFTFWKNCKDTFDINNHVFLEKENGEVDDEKLNNICEKLLNAPYPAKTSPWEIHLVKNYNNDQLSIPNNNSKDQRTFVLLFKVHHCLGDGVANLTAIVEGIGEHSLTNIKVPVPKFRKRNLWESLTFYATFPFSAFYEMSYVLSHLFRSSPWKVPDSKKEWYHFCSKSDLIPIEKVKFIKNQFDVCFTSVLLSAVSFAIHQSLNNVKRKMLDADPERNLKNDCSMYCMTVLPLAGRPKKLTNHNTYALFDLPIDTFESSIDRLNEVEKMLELAKNTSFPAVVPFYNFALGCNFYPVGNLLGTQRMVPAGLTNFPSVPIEMERNGIKCIAADFMAGALGGVAGVGIMVLSYGEYIRVAVTAEKAVMTKEEVNRFAKNVTNEIDKLYMFCAQP